MRGRPPRLRTGIPTEAVGALCSRSATHSEPRRDRDAFGGARGDRRVGARRPRSAEPAALGFVRTPTVTAGLVGALACGCAERRRRCPVQARLPPSARRYAEPLRQPRPRTGCRPAPAACVRNRRDISRLIAAQSPCAWSCIPVGPATTPRVSSSAESAHWGASATFRCACPTGGRARDALPIDLRPGAAPRRGHSRRMAQVTRGLNARGQPLAVVFGEAQQDGLDERRVVIDETLVVSLRRAER